MYKNIKVAITCDIDEEERIRMLVYYHEAITVGGAVPLIVPPYTDEERLAEWLDCVQPDGLMLSGGSDINPAIYGEKPEAGLGRVSKTRDAYELALLKLAIGKGIPVLGICRGLQTINVAFGGTLIQDMPAQMGKEYAYHDQKQPTWQPVHEVTFSDNSKVGKLFGTNRIMTNSHHHQCTDRLGKGLIASGHTADGVIEALETPDGKIMAVQFHPERMVYTERRMSEFFSQWCNSLKS